MIGRTAEEVLAEGEALRIDGDRLMRRLDALAEIGAIDGGGAAAWRSPTRTGRAAISSSAGCASWGSTSRSTAIGNVFGRRARHRATSAPVMTGSHIDTVRTGGRYDGNLGVLGGLEVVATLNDAGVAHAAAAGRRVLHQRGRRALRARHAGLARLRRRPAARGGARRRRASTARASATSSRASATPATRRCGVHRPHAYVELHIEQGPVLDPRAAPSAPSTDLQGISWQEIAITGQSNHAGTTPMRLRHDAGYCAAAIGTFLRAPGARDRRQPGLHGGQRATLHPNLINVIAARAQRDGRPAQHRRGAAAASGAAPGARSSTSSRATRA